MKRIITLFLVLSLCLSLTSCNYAMVKYNPYVYLDADILLDRDYIQDHSNNFDEKFFESFNENYVYESNLCYYSASVWEAEEERDTGSSRERHRYSMIDGFGDKQFIARSSVSRGTFPALADVMCYQEVYRHKEAPNPMTDWTIKSFSVIMINQMQSPWKTEYENGTDTKGAKNYYGKGFITLEQLAVSQMSLFDNESNRICTFDRESDPEFIELVEKRCARPLSIIEMHDYLAIYPRDGSSYYCYAVIRFEESDNIVWCGELRRDSKFSKIYIVSPQNTDEERGKFGIIDGEYAKKIYDLIFPETERSA